MLKVTRSIDQCIVLAGIDIQEVVCLSGGQTELINEKPIHCKVLSANLKEKERGNKSGKGTQLQCTQWFHVSYQNLSAHNSSNAVS